MPPIPFHRFQVLDERQLDTGIIHRGDLARTRSFMHKLVSGVPVHVGVLCCFA